MQSGKHLNRKENKMTQHVEFTIDFDLTCWGQDAEDFIHLTEYDIIRNTKEWIENNPWEIVDHMKIKNIWYEDD